MGETLTQRRRVGDEGLRVVKPCRKGRNRYRLIPGSVDGTLQESTG
jgi:hypothetical protein